MIRPIQETLRDLAIFVLLVAIGVAGRWGQPVWEFTPIAAISIFAGCYFSSWLVAALVPVATLAITDLRLLPYDSIVVMIVTYLSMAVAALLGRLLREKTHGWQTARRLAVCSFAPATLFFVATNLAVWLFSSDVAYAKTPAGLIQCYTAAVPFFRAMLAGDLFYLGVLFGCAMLAGEWSLRRAPAPERVRTLT